MPNSLPVSASPSLQLYSIQRQTYNILGEGTGPRSKIIEGGSWSRVNPQLCTKAESGVGGVSQYQPVLL